LWAKKFIMVNKTITILQIRRILQLLQEGRSKRQIAKDLSISRNNIDNYEEKYLQSGQLYIPAQIDPIYK
jgi:hypothetical protein